MSASPCASATDEVAALTCRFMRALGYRGILDIGYRYDARDGRYKVLDVNPRLGATFRLFVGDDGMDVVRALYRDLTGQPIPASRACVGRKWLVEDLDLSRRACATCATASSARARGCARSPAFAKRAGSRTTICARSSPCAATSSHASRARFGRQTGVVRPSAPPPAPADVTRQFARATDAWRRVYSDGDRLQPLAYQERLAAALRWVDELGLPFDGHALDLGCGAGLLSVALAQRGYHVHAVDATPGMVALANERAARAGVTRVNAQLGDAHALEFDDDSFDLVVALGLLPWLRSETRALGEMARVLKPRGTLIVTADHRAPLHRLLNPRSTPTLAPLRGVVKRIAGDDAPPATVVSKRHAPDAVDRLIRTRACASSTAPRSASGPSHSWDGRYCPSGRACSCKRG